MKDRIPTYPGRVRLTPVTGQENVYDMERADAPTEAGTPLDKANLLTDATAAALGLTDDAAADEEKATVSNAISKAGALAALALSGAECGTYTGSGYNTILGFARKPKAVLIAELTAATEDNLAVVTASGGLTLGVDSSGGGVKGTIAASFDSFNRVSFDNARFSADGCTYCCIAVADDTPKLIKKRTFAEDGYFVVPKGIEKLFVHLVGGGGGGGTLAGGTYNTGTPLFRGHMGGGSGYAVSAELDVSPGDALYITVGRGGAEGEDGTASIITKNEAILAQASGGSSGNSGGAGGSGGGAADCVWLLPMSGAMLSAGGAGGSDGADAEKTQGFGESIGGAGQRTTTRDFGLSNGMPRARGGGGGGGTQTPASAGSGNGGNAKYRLTDTSGSEAVNSAVTAGSDGIVILSWEESV